MRNEALDIRPGRKPKVSVEEIIECLRKLPNNPTLTRLTAEMDVPMRTIQYALKAAGMTFAEAKKKAKAQQ
jgi:hypothetical protein